MNDYFIAGFFTGEGFFHVQKINKCLSFTIGIKMHNRDKYILECIREYLQAGYIKKPRLECSEYSINNYKEILIFKERIYPLLQGYKRFQADEFFDKLEKYKEDKHRPSYTSKNSFLKVRNDRSQISFLN